MQPKKGKQIVGHIYSQGTPLNELKPADITSQPR